RPPRGQLGPRGRRLAQRPRGERVMRYWVQLATEQFPPSELVDQAGAAEPAGFDAVNVSDHLQPGWEPGESSQAWALLGAIGQATDRVEVGTGVTAPVYRYHPAVVARLGATLQ